MNDGPTPSPKGLIILLIASVVLALTLADDLLTPLWLRASPPPVPGVKWLVVLAEATPLGVILTGHRGLGVSISLALAVANLLALALNFVASMALGELSLFYFYLLQLITVVMAWRALRREPIGERRYGTAAAAVGVWGALILIIATMT